jgi:aconitate hydratase
VLLKVGDNVSTDEILQAGAKALPFRSNIPEISKFAFAALDATYYDRALEQRDHGGHLIVAGDNYGQGSSREHAAIAPRYLGLHAVIAKRFARIHAQNLVNFGVLPLTFADESDYERVDNGDDLVIPHVGEQIRSRSDVTVENRTKGHSYCCSHSLTRREVDLISAGSLITFLRDRGHASA